MTDNVGSGNGCSSNAAVGVTVVPAGQELDVNDAGPGLHPTGQQWVVLAQRVPLEVGRKVDVDLVGVAPERDAEHLPRLPLVPVGAGVHGNPGIGLGTVADQVRLDGHAQVADRVVDPCQQLEPGLATGQAPAHLGRGGIHGRLQVDLGVHVPAVRRWHPVDGREEVEVRHGAAVAQGAGCVHPGLGGNADADVYAGYDMGFDEAVAQRGAQRGNERVATVVDQRGLCL